MFSVQFNKFIYAQIIAHDVHFKFEVMNDNKVKNKIYVTDETVTSR